MDDIRWKSGQIQPLARPRALPNMIEKHLGSPTINRALAIAWLVASTLSLVAACDQFDTRKTVETCVTRSMKQGEPFGNPKERAESEVQFRHYCAKAAARQM
jgi:hypothetical protein